MRFMVSYDIQRVIILYFIAQMIPYLVSGNPFKLTSVSFWYAYLLYSIWLWHLMPGCSLAWMPFTLLRTLYSLFFHPQCPCHRSLFPCLGSDTLLWATMGPMLWLRQLSCLTTFNNLWTKLFQKEVSRREIKTKERKGYKEKKGN